MSSVVAEADPQNFVKLIKSKRDYVNGIETCKFAYEWVINDVEYDPIEIKSPKFSSNYSDFDDEWILTIDPKCVLRGERQYAVIQLKSTSFNEFNDDSKLQTKCLIIVDKNGLNRYSYSSIPMRAYWHIGKFGATVKSTLNNVHFRRQKFRIYCRIKMSKKITNNVNEIPRFNATQQLMADLEKLLLNEKSADVTIKVGQKSFRAIKGVLGARSPVFFAMFNHEEFEENKNNEVVIEDIEEDVFEEFLHFIYTGESPNINEMPMELLAVAEKYQVGYLKNVCEAILCRTINLDNFASMIVCSDEYNLKKLNGKCLKFMKTNYEAILSNNTFKVYKKKHPEVFVNFFEKLLTNKLGTTLQEPRFMCRVS